MRVFFSSAYMLICYKTKYTAVMDREQAKRFMVLWLSKRDQERNKKELEWKTLIWQQLERRRRVSVAVIFFSKRLERRYWMNKLQQQWFDDMWRLRGNEIVSSFFRKEFRVSVPTFEYIINIVRVPMMRQTTIFREAISLEKRVGIALWKLSTGNTYRSVGKAFGVSAALCCEVLLEFCTVLYMLAPRYITFPEDEHECSREILLFRRYTSCPIPQVAGAIDCTHVKIKKPANEFGADYFNRKQTYSINTQAVVGERLKFMDVSTGFPGSIHDSRVLRHSTFARRAQNDILQEPTKRINNYDIKPMILGDSAYPPFRWLLKPFTRHRNLTAEEKHFNRTVSSARSMVERAFGLLKMRWRCLYKTLEADVEHVATIIIACCVLHNICQEREVLDQAEEFLLRAILANERAFNQAARNRGGNNFCNNFDVQRQILKDYLQGN